MSIRRCLILLLLCLAPLRAFAGDPPTAPIPHDEGNVPTTSSAGALVMSFIADSAASRGGMQVGDLITHFNGELVDSTEKLAQLVHNAAPGSFVSVEVQRAGQVQTLKIKLDGTGGHGALGARIVTLMEPPTAPMLRIETGMHTAIIRSICADAAGRFLVTGSADKTARVWDAHTGALLQTLRPPLSLGQEGEIDAVAISPDGSTVACAGYTGWLWDNQMSIYLFDRANGQMLRRISGLPQVVQDLAFSHDGQMLAAALVGKNGVRVFHAADGSLAGQDKDYGDSSYSVDWDNSGRLVTACFDGYVRLYDSNLTLLAKVRPDGGTQPFTARFSPDGSRVAVGFYDKPRVALLSGRDLSRLHAPKTEGMDSGDLSSVEWSSDGAFLYAGGTYTNSESLLIPVVQWANGGTGARREFAATQNTVMDLRALPNGDIAWGTGDPAWGIIDSSGRSAVFHPTPDADYRGTLNGFQISAEGNTVAFGFESMGKIPARFNLAKRALEDVGQSELLSPPRVDAPGLVVTDWKDNYAPKLNGTPLPLQATEFSRSLAIAPDGQSFVLGTGYYLHHFDRNGKELWKLDAGCSFWDVNISSDGRIVCAALDDGTIRWLRLSDGKELLSFFPSADRQRWVAWTPSGYYDCSAGGEDLIGWSINRGKDHAADFFPASKFHDRFYRPDVIQKVLSTLDESEALRLADAESGRKTDTTTPVATDITQSLPPVVTILSPQPGDALSTATVQVKYSVRTPSGDAVTAVRALVDGRPVGNSRDLQIVSTDGETREISVPVPPRDCEIALIAENKNGSSVASRVSVVWNGTKPDEFVIKPKLYVLAIGISNYQDPTLKLDFSAKDATDFAAALTSQKGGLYSDVTVKVLTDAAATRDGILDGLDWIQHQTTSHDVAMVFLSGHGANDEENRYYFIPDDFDRAHFRSSTVAFSEFQNTIQAIAGKALFFVDSCHSGNVMGTGKTKGLTDVNAMINELSSAENGAVVFSASTGSQVSWEDPKWGNGAFTKALVEGLKGAADYNHNGRITVNMLDLYISDRVKELTGGKQTPTTQKPPTIPDFPVVIDK